MLRIVLYAVLLGLLASCAGLGRTAGEGSFHKRTHHLGRSADLDRKQVDAPRVEQDEQLMAELPQRTELNRPEPERRRPLAASTTVLPPHTAHHRSQAPAVVVAARTRIDLSDTDEPVDVQPTEEAPKARWNVPSIIAGSLLVLSLLSALVSGGTTYFGYLLLATFIAGLVGIISASLRKERGKGLAIAALVFSIAFVITLAVALSRLE